MAIVEFTNNQSPYLNADNLNKIQEGNVYSTDELEIGVWVNGEKLYRKCLIFNDEISTDTLFTKAHGIQNAKTIMIKYAGYYFVNNGISYPLNIVGYNSNLTDKGYCYADRTNVYIYGNGGWNTGWYKIFILEYTKLEEQEES